MVGQESIMSKPGWIIIGAAFALFACAIVALAIGAAGGSAVQDALAAGQDASATQSSTNVCVGLFNIGACRSEQQSVSSTTRTQSSQPPSPWAIIAVITLLVMGAVAASLVGLGDPPDYI
jgi:hypothetical protein